MSGRPFCAAIALSAFALAACPKPPTQQADAGAPDAGPLICPAVLRIKPPASIYRAAVAGEWNSFVDQPLAADGSGAFTAQLQLAPGTYAYEVVLDGARGLDPSNGYRKYSQGIERSALRVPDCRLPSLAVFPGSVSKARPAAGSGNFQASISLTPGAGASGCSIDGSLRSTPGANAETSSTRTLTADELHFDGARAEIALSGLPDGKHTVVATARCGDFVSERLLLPFWIEERDFRFEDGPLYMAVTDRFRDGEPANDTPVSGAVDSLNYFGGDLQGVEQALREGYFDSLGVRSIWLTPWQTQPEGTWLDRDGANPGTGYHGYWPVRAREVSARLGGEAALRSLIAEAHRHGIRVLMDAVLNHVHRDHEYFQDPQKRLWFRTGCVCGSPGCDWTEKRLSCLFTEYLPDVDWTNEAASEQLISDVLWWLETYDLDGLRLDAVKHVEDLATFNLATRVRETFEQAGTRYFLMGETAMGWAGDKVADNQLQYDTIKRYLGPLGLDGQLDFVLYHAVPYRVFAWGARGFLHADYWTDVSQKQFAGSTMINFLGSHDAPRFLSLSAEPSLSYDQMSARRFADLPAAPSSSEPYDRHFLAMLNLATLPGVPLLYYGDEYGEFGGGDPDNRHWMRFGSDLSPQEKAQLDRAGALLKARSRLRGLGRGPMVRALVTEDLYAYARPDSDPAQGALVALNRLSIPVQASIPVPSELGWAAGTRLADSIRGPTVQVASDPSTGRPTISVQLPARGGVLLSVANP